MKKLAKFLSLFAVLVAMFGALVAFSACDSEYELKMNTRYIDEEDTDLATEQQTYYIFNSNGMGAYHYYYNSSYDGVYDYVITFKYVYADSDKSAVVCFYDGVEYSDNHIATKSVSSEWNRLLTVSGNVLASAGSYGYTFFINENYLPQIPNYGK